MPISDWIEKLGRVVFETPFGALDAAAEVPELAEIRLALLDEVKAKSHRVARQYVFPFNVVRLRLMGVPEGQDSIFHGDFFARYCEEELRAGLSRSGYRFPKELRVEVATTPELPQAGGRWVLVEVESQVQPTVEAPSRTGSLHVVKGEANLAQLPLSKVRTNIGRSAEVYRTDGPSRKNDLAFDETGEVNRTVSREHAHVLFDSKTGQYRLFNDRWYKADGKPDQTCGLWVFRDGLSQPIHRDARGFLLQPGDEIHLGRAVLRFATD